MPNQVQTIRQCLRSGIVGCGAIGSLYDEGDRTKVLSHAAAYAVTKGVELTAICDSNRERLGRCGEARGVQARYTSLQEMLDNERLDILSICTPVEFRLESIKAAVQAGVRVILCEKPLAPSVDEAESIAGTVNGSQSTLLLNFQRRWDPGLQEAARMIQSGEIGELQCGFCVYEKGLAHNGSHMIDLLSMFLGRPARLRVVRDSTMQPADPVTPTFDAEFRYDASGPALVYLSAVDYSRYSIFEVDLLGTHGRIAVTNSGRDVKVFTVDRDKTYAGYKALKPVREIPTAFDDHLKLVIQHAVSIGNNPSVLPVCGLKEGIDNLKVVDTLLQAYERKES